MSPPFVVTSKNIFSLTLDVKEVGILISVLVYIFIRHIFFSIKHASSKIANLNIAAKLITGHSVRIKSRIIKIRDKGDAFLLVVDAVQLVRINWAFRFPLIYLST